MFLLQFLIKGVHITPLQLAHIAVVVVEPGVIPVAKVLFRQFSSQLFHLPPHGRQPLRVDFVDDPPGIGEGILDLQEPP